MLNFDPHRWLAEREGAKSVATVATVARVHAEIEKSVLKASPATVATTATFRGWQECIGRLAPYQPRTGFAPDRWRTLLADAQWLAERHGEAAAALGWTESDLFGLDPLPGWGGLADRLDGARNVALTDRIAHWRADDLEGWLWRRTLRPMPTLWEVGGHG